MKKPMGKGMKMPKSGHSPMHKEMGGAMKKPASSKSKVKAKRKGY